MISWPGWFAAPVVLMASSSVFAACSDSTAELRWNDGKVRFAVEIADDEAERAQGLMFRDRLPASAGMLFLYDRPQPVTFWMKNTLIPLDMLFIDGNGRVKAIHPDAKPGDLSTIPGPSDTQMVLEIGGGLAAKLGLPVGAEMRSPKIDQQQAVWPCAQP